MKTMAELIQNPWGMVLLATALLLICGHLLLFFEALSRKRTVWYAILCALAAAGGFVWLTAMVDCMRVQVGDVIHLTFFADMFWYRPWWRFGAVLLSSLVFSAGCVVFCVLYDRTHLTHDSPKEALDKLPVGVCFGNEKGTPVMSNLRMQEYCSRLFGQRLDNVEEFWNALVAIGAVEGDGCVVATDTSVILFRSSWLPNEQRCRQIVATDITRQYRTTAELQAMGDKLRDVQVRMLTVQAEQEALATAQELLAARIYVHNELGHHLLEGKYYFEHRGEMDDQTILSRLRSIAETKPDSTAEDALAEAIGLAKAIGVSVCTEGDVPQDENDRTLVAQAVRECATNTIKHGQGDRLWVHMSQNGANRIVTLSDNGVPPQGEIRETGGLLSLRRTVEGMGGTMQTHIHPSFGVTIVLPIRKSQKKCD